MADQKVGVDFEIKTHGSKGAMDDVSAATRQATDALDAAGKSTKTLGQDMAATRNQGKELAEATKRVNAALRENNDTLKVHGAESKQAAESQKRLNAAQEEVKRLAAAQAQAIEKNAKAVTELAQAEDGKLTPATKRLAAQVTRMSSDFDKATSDVRRLDLQIALAAKSADKGGKSMSGFMASFAGNLAANAVGHLTDKLREGAMFVLETGATYETLRMALETTTGSASKAASEFERLQAFAAKTPFSVEELTESYIKLSNRGIEPTERALTSFGNTASAMGKTLNDYVEAVADAITGENERLKEFGVVGKKSGDQIMYTFRGVTTAVKFDAASITNYLTQIGENNFAGGMEKQATTMAGMWSTLKDNAAAFADQMMQGGVSQALKDVMAGLIESTGGAESFATALGKDLGDAIRNTVDLIKYLVGIGKSAVEMFGSTTIALTALGAAAAALAGPFGIAAVAGVSAGHMIAEAFSGANREMDAMVDRANDIRAKERKEALKQQAAELDMEFEGAAAQHRRHEKTLELEKRYAEKLRKQGLDEMAITRRVAGMSLAVAGQNRNLGGGTGDDRLAEWENMLTDKPKPKKEKKAGRAKAKKDPNKLAADQMDFDSDVSNYAAGQNKGAREEAIAAQQEAFEAESAIRQRRVEEIEREMELFDAQAEQQAEQIDAVFFMIDTETDAEDRRRELFNERMAREQEMADWQAKNAKTQAQREEAQTRLIDIEQKKRLNAVKLAAAAETKEVAKRQAVYQKFTGITQDLAKISVDAAWQSAEGQKGAFAMALGEYLKSVSKQMAVKALVEAALGAAALAGVISAGLAPGHFIAAGMAAAAAAAAGGAGIAASAIGNARAGSGKKTAGEGQSIDEGAFPDGRPGIPSTGGNGQGSQKPADEGRKLEPLDHPISYDEARRGGKSQAAQGAGVTIHVGTFVGGGSPKEAAQALQKLLDENKSAGRRY